MSLLVLKSGLLDTIQDLGRFGYAHLGIPAGGAADPVALQVANVLVGNAPGTAGIEMHFPAPGLRFEQDTVFALGGADFSARLNGREVPVWKPHRAEAGNELIFHSPRNGMRAYLSVLGGFDIPPWLGSCSTLLSAGAGGKEGRALRSGDRLPLAAHTLPAKNIRPVRANVQGLYPASAVIRFMPGPEYNVLEKASRRQLETASWSISLHSNRMACALEGPPAVLREPLELVSSAVQPGTVQLLPSGELLVLMADCQTTGGYPRIAQIFQADLPGLAQFRPGASFQLQQSNLESATTTARQQRQLLRQLHWGCAWIWK